MGNEILAFRSRRYQTTRFGVARFSRYVLANLINVESGLGGMPVLSNLQQDYSTYFVTTLQKDGRVSAYVPITSF